MNLPPIYHDTLPRTGEDYTLEYTGFWGCESSCRIRVYRRDASINVPVVIVATEIPENEGTSISNLAELVHSIAWRQSGGPVPVTFIEHYPGDRVLQMEEGFSVVTFPMTPEAGRTDIPLVWMSATTGERAFGQPEWRHASRGEVEAAIRTMLLDYDPREVRI